MPKLVVQNPAETPTVLAAPIQSTQVALRSPCRELGKPLLEPTVSVNADGTMSWKLARDRGAS